MAQAATWEAPQRQGWAMNSFAVYLMGAAGARERYRGAAAACWSAGPHRKALGAPPLPSHALPARLLCHGRPPAGHCAGWAEPKEGCGVRMG